MEHRIVFTTELNGWNQILVDALCECEHVTEESGRGYVCYLNVKEIESGFITAERHSKEVEIEIKSLHKKKQDSLLELCSAEIYEKTYREC